MVERVGFAYFSHSLHALSLRRLSSLTCKSIPLFHLALKDILNVFYHKSLVQFESFLSFMVERVGFAYFSHSLHALSLRRLSSLTCKSIPLFHLALKDILNVFYHKSLVQFESFLSFMVERVGFAYFSHSLHALSLRRLSSLTCKSIPLFHLALKDILNVFYHKSLVQFESFLSFMVERVGFEPT